MAKIPRSQPNRRKPRKPTGTRATRRSPEAPMPLPPALVDELSPLISALLLEDLKQFPNLSHPAKET